MVVRNGSGMWIAVRTAFVARVVFPFCRELHQQRIRRIICRISREIWLRVSHETDITIEDDADIVCHTFGIRRADQKCAVEVMLRISNHLLRRALLIEKNQEFLGHKTPFIRLGGCAVKGKAAHPLSPRRGRPGGAVIVLKMDYVSRTKKTSLANTGGLRAGCEI